MPSRRSHGQAVDTRRTLQTRQPRSAIKDKMKKIVSGKLRSLHQGDVHKLQLATNLRAVWQGALVDESAATAP